MKPTFAFPAEIPSQALQKVSGFTPQWLRTLAKQGLYPPPVHGVYQCAKTLAALFAHLHSRLTERVDVAGLEAKKLAKEIEKLEEQITEAKRDNAHGERKLVQLTDVETTWINITSAVRQRFLNLPSKVQSQHRPSMTALQLRKLLEQEVDDALSDLAKPPDYSPRGADTEE